MKDEGMARFGIRAAACQTADSSTPPVALRAAAPVGMTMRLRVGIRLPRQFS